MFAKGCERKSYLKFLTCRQTLANFSRKYLDVLGILLYGIVGLKERGRVVSFNTVLIQILIRALQDQELFNCKQMRPNLNKLGNRKMY